MNPLLEKFNAAPFQKIEVANYKPAIKEAINQALEEIEAISKASDTPTFENTVVALDNAGEQLDRITSIFFNLNSAETNEEIQSIAREISPWLSEFKNDITLNAALFSRIRSVYDQKEQLNLNTEQAMLLEKQYKSFTRNGANLEESAKTTLRNIDAQLAKLSLEFGEHVLAETNAFSLHITDEKDLEGLPEGTKEAAKMLAQQRELDGWVFTLDYPSYVPFMTYAANRDLRKKWHLPLGEKDSSPMRTTMRKPFLTSLNYVIKERTY